METVLFSCVNRRWSVRLVVSSTLNPVIRSRLRAVKPGPNRSPSCPSVTLSGNVSFKKSRNVLSWSPTSCLQPERVFGNSPTSNINKTRTAGSIVPSDVSSVFAAGPFAITLVLLFIGCQISMDIFTAYIGSKTVCDVYDLLVAFLAHVLSVGV